MVFILIGLELPFIIKGLKDYSITQAIGYGLLISLVIILIRILYVFSVALLTRRLSEKIRSAEPNVGWRGLIIVGWAGMRGVVSLATALSVPFVLSTGEKFPQRDLILFISFTVILITLVFQGLTLPLLVKRVKIHEIDNILPEEKQDAMIHLKLIKSSLKYLQEKYSSEITRNPLLENLKNHLKNESFYIDNQLNSSENDKEEMKLYQSIYIELISVQREELQLLKKDFNDEVIRKQEMRLDLDEQKFHPSL